jgi:amidase
MQDATALAAAIAGGRTTAVAAMQAALAAAQALDRALDRLGALARLAPDQGLADATAADRAPAPARGPFHGVPFLMKDLGSAARGLAPGAGSAALRQRLTDPPADSNLAARFRAGGLIPFGLTTVPEFGLALTAEPPGAPPARNPWDETLSPGGSSGGAAAAVAAGIVAIAHATDAAGSIRVPAACTGLVGLKPSRGAVPGGPDFGNHLMGLASELVLARSVRDVATAFDLATGHIAGPCAEPAQRALPSRPRIALAIPARCDTPRARATEAAADALARTGCDIETIPAPDALGLEAHHLCRIVLTVSLAEWLDALAIPLSAVTPLSAAVAREGRAMPATALFAASRALARLSAQATRLFDSHDALLSPVLSGPPPRIGHFSAAETDPASRFAAMEALAPNAALANAAGLPALALPFGLHDGLPVAVSLLGPPGADRALLALAQRIEVATPPLAFPFPLAGLP